MNARNKIAGARKRQKLTLVEVGLLINRSAVSVEAYERMPDQQVASLLGGTKAYRACLERIMNADRAHATPVLFGTYPLVFARMALCMSVKDVAHTFGYRPHTWVKFESGARLIPETVVHALEGMVKDKLCRVLFLQKDHSWR